MNQYKDIKETPLRFHMFYSTFMLPMTLFLNVFNFISSIIAFVKTKEMDAVDVCTTILTLFVIVLSFFAWRGLPRFKKKGLVFAFSLISLEVIIGILNLIMGLIAQDSIIALSSVLSLTLYALILFYYIKRLPLFSSEGFDNKVESTENAQNVEEIECENKEEIESDLRDEKEEIEVKEYDCPRCGFHIIDGSVFCPHCGAQTRSVR